MNSEMILSEKTIADYNVSRRCSDKSLICHAPSVNLNFDQYGNARACCYNFTHVLGVWPQKSIKEIWQGKEIAELRGYIAGNNLGGGCIECGKMIEMGNNAGVRAGFFDEFASSPLRKTMKGIARSFTKEIVYPKVMEFELTNECNLECIMCNGMFSSSIRKNREKLPALISPYDDRFVEQLDEFIPHLTDAKFLGGEPFMIEIYVKIWERIAALNPSIRIHITTNGTFLNSRIKKLLEGLRAGIILSIDSIVPETYHTIRIGANLDKVMGHLAYFREYTARKKTFLSMAVCPITQNWHELPGMLDFCLDKNIALYMNAVFSPPELSLHEQSADYLSEVISVLQKHPVPAVQGSRLTPRNLSIQAYKDFINMLEGWHQESLGSA
jgi:MoaA/NifB/PqqE/SkfB family radical SAM enzyme